MKQTKTVVPKKEVRKYQNDPYSNKQLRDPGYSDKKVQNYPRDGDNYQGDGYRIGSYNDPENGDGGRGDGRDGDRGDGRDRGYGYGGNRDGKGRGNDNYDGEDEPGYKVYRDNNYAKNPSKSQAIFVPINRKTHDPNQYNPVDTKLNGDERRGRRGYG